MHNLVFIRLFISTRATYFLSRIPFVSFLFPSVKISSKISA